MRLSHYRALVKRYGPGPKERRCDCGAPATHVVTFPQLAATQEPYTAVTFTCPACTALWLVDEPRARQLYPPVNTANMAPAGNMANPVPSAALAVPRPAACLRSAL